MLILGIETSCDETAAAVVKMSKGTSNGEGAFEISSAISSSRDSHVTTGGIIPEVAARKQIENIIPVIDKALKTAKLGIENLDAISVVHGPGLIGSLLVGVETAKTLALVWNKPIIPVNHLVAHLYANWISPAIPTKAGTYTNNLPQFPLVGLVVSGGHTDFVLMKGHGDIKYLGGTRDDAAGEAFDKTARLLGLPYPGGPEIAKASEPYLAQELNLFPRPMINEDTIDTSFSGLKTAVKNYLSNNQSPLTIHRLAAEIQEAIVDTLTAKSVKAVETYNPKSFLLAGGVSANKRLREKIKSALNHKTKVFIPDIKYTTDNATMVATAALYNYKPVPWQRIAANPALSIEQ